MAVYNPGGRRSPEPDHAGSLTSSLQNSEKRISVVEAPIYCILFRRPLQTRTDLFQYEDYMTIDLACMWLKDVIYPLMELSIYRAKLLFWSVMYYASPCISRLGPVSEFSGDELMYRKVLCKRQGICPNKRPDVYVI